MVLVTEFLNGVDQTITLYVQAWRLIQNARKTRPGSSACLPSKQRFSRNNEVPTKESLPRENRCRPIVRPA